MSSQGIQALCEFPDIRIEFSRDAFASDPRVANIVWEVDFAASAGIESNLSDSENPPL